MRNPIAGLGFFVGVQSWIWVEGRGSSDEGWHVMRGFVFVHHRYQFGQSTTVSGSQKALWRQETCPSSSWKSITVYNDNKSWIFADGGPKWKVNSQWSQWSQWHCCIARWSFIGWPWSAEEVAGTGSECCAVMEPTGVDMVDMALTNGTWLIFSYFGCMPDMAQVDTATEIISEMTKLWDQWQLQCGSKKTHLPPAL